MTFDRDLFEFLGALAGFLGLVVSIGSVLYARRQAIAAEGPRSPHVEVAEATWTGQPAGWARVSINTRNHTSEGWDMESAKLASPKGGLLIAGHLISTYNDYGEQEVRIPQDAELFGATTKPWTYVLPPGSGLRHPQGPSADCAREDLYLKLPHGTARFKLVVTFRRKSGVGRREKLTVIGYLPTA